MRRGASEAVRLARERGERIYLVGGAVRDLLLGRPVRDLDLVLEGDAPGFAAALAKRLDARAVVVHERFGTASLDLPQGIRLDVAATRKETYAYPGALPAVSRGASLPEDLARRDFTIHAMALELSARGGVVHDPFGGRKDLAAGRLRFLHPASPTDDPTRAFRAVRYANRLGFSLVPDGRRAVAEALAIGAFDAVSGDRLRRELELIFAEPRRGRAVGGLHRLELDRAIARALARSVLGAPERVRAAERIARNTGAGWLCYLVAWMGPARESALREVADRLALTGRDALALRRWASTRRRFGAGIARLAPSRLRRRAAGLSTEEVVAAAALRTGPDRKALVRLAGRGAPELAISGGDLLARGVRPGPAIGRALDATRDALEDGRLASAAGEQLAFALLRARRTR
jgi:tRNA nucleotidyltransferase (CCA-adding enzyme)